MYRGKHEARRSKKSARKGRLNATIISVVLILTLAVGGTIAFLSTKTDPVVNTFNPSQVTCSVVEDFDGKTKTNVNVENTGDIPAFIRVKLVAYRTNDAGQHIGGVSEVPAFTLGKGWAKYGECLQIVCLRSLSLLRITRMWMAAISLSTSSRRPFRPAPKRPLRQHGAQVSQSIRTAIWSFRPATKGVARYEENM